MMKTLKKKNLKIDDVDDDENNKIKGMNNNRLYNLGDSQSVEL